MTVGLSRYLAQQPKLRDRSGRECLGAFDDSSKQSSRAVIVAHDFYGLTPQIRSVMTRFAREGFLAFAPDFYRGSVAQTPEQAKDLARRLAWNQVAVELGLAVSALKQRQPGIRVAVVGFAMGGAAAIVAAAAVADLDAAVTFYGIPQDVRVENPRIRIQGHFAFQDVKCTPERIAELDASLGQSGVSHELHHYEAENGFFNPTRAAWSPEHAEKAWARTLQFLGSALA